MTTRSPSSAAAGSWRVNLDIRDGVVTARPEVSLEQLTDELLDLGVPVALIDLDRSVAGTPGTALLEAAARRHPGRLWLGGGLRPDGHAAWRLLDSGAAGIILGSSGLIAAGRLRPTALAALARFSDPGRIMASIDVLSGQIVTSGFTTLTTLTGSQALDAVVQATGGRCPVLYTDAAAALRFRPAVWPQIEALAACYPAIPLWYAGGLSSWADVTRVWRAGLGAVTGRAYLTGPLGLPDRESIRDVPTEVTALPSPAKGQGQAAGHRRSRA
jgi:phosphoribosylformimino-5-aminoimidazole carboxamide ribonucleotide (ProFAR) isomerase